MHVMSLMLLRGLCDFLVYVLLLSVGVVLTNTNHSDMNFDSLQAFQGHHSPRPET